MLVSNDCHFKNFRRKNMLHPILLVLTLTLAECSRNVKNYPSSSQLDRFRRDETADKLTPLVENMQRLARLTNGIALEIGLIDGTISSDSVISELLHMDTLKPKDITDLDPTIIDNALVELDKLHQEVKVSGEVTDIQKRLILLNDVGETAKTFMTEFFELEGKDAYKTALEGFATSLPMISQQVALLKKELVSLDGAVDTLNNYPVFTTETDASDALNRITGYFASFRQMQKLATSSEPVWTELQSLKSLKAKSDFMQLIEKEQKLRDDLRQYRDDPRPKDVDTLKNIFKKVFGARDKIKQSQASFTTVNKLALSRATRRQSLVLTGGLPNGKSDIESLNSDSSNPWIVERVDDSSVVTASLKIAFASFDEFTREFGNVEKKWKDMVTNQASVTSILDLLSVLSTSDSDEIEIAATADSLITCHTSLQIPNPEKIWTPVQDNVKKLNSLLDQINNLKEIEELKDMKSVIGILQKHTEQGDKIQIANSIVKAVKEDATYKKVSGIIVRLKKYLDDHDKLIAEITSTIPAITDSYNEINKYHSGLKHLPVYPKFFDCLYAVGDQGTHLKKSMDFVQKMQTTDYKFNEVRSVIMPFLDSKSDMTLLVESAGKIKKSKFKEAHTLKPNFYDSMEVSRRLSKAVPGFVVIKEIQEKWRVWVSFVSKVKKLEKDPNRNSWSKNNEQKVQELVRIKDDVERTIGGIEDFLKELDETGSREEYKKRVYRGRRSEDKVLDLRDFWKLFTVAEDIPDVRVVKESLDGIKEAVTEISKNTSKMINAGLDEIGRLNLEFSKFGFEDSIKSLAAINLFFTNYGTDMAEVEKIVVVPRFTQEVVEEPEINYQLIEFLIWGLPCSIGLFILAFAKQLNYIWRRCHRRNY